MTFPTHEEPCPFEATDADRVKQLRTMAAEQAQRDEYDRAQRRQFSAGPNVKARRDAVRAAAEALSTFRVADNTNEEGER